MINEDSNAELNKPESCTKCTSRQPEKTLEPSFLPTCVINPEISVRKVQISIRPGFFSEDLFPNQAEDDRQCHAFDTNLHLPCTRRTGAIGVTWVPSSSCYQASAFTFRWSETFMYHKWRNILNEKCPQVQTWQEQYAYTYKYKATDRPLILRV